MSKAATEAKLKNLATYQAGLKRNLRYLGSFFAILLILGGLILLVNGIVSLVTRPVPNGIDENKNNSSIIPTVSPTPDDKKDIIDGVENQKDNATTPPGAEKARQTAARIERTRRWHATDYVKGDIKDGIYLVKLGDTLWEISEAVYGSGTRWGLILEHNKDKIGRLKNGQQALIVPGQLLLIVSLGTVG